jgi:hypothetical protein
MFFRAFRHKKIADTVLGQVAPFLNVVSNLGRVVPARLASDKYVLGFLTGNIGMEMQRAGAASLDAVGKGTVMSLVVNTLFGKGVVNEPALTDLMLGVPAPDAEFSRGLEAAAKIYAAASGRHKLQNDPDYLAAKDVVQRAGESLDFITPGAGEDSKIAGQMLRMLFYQRVVDKYQPVGE